MMLIPIEYRIRRDNGEKCLAAYRLNGVRQASGQIILAHTKTAARRKATAAGWVRVKLGTCGPMVDLCPECAAGREVSS